MNEKEQKLYKKIKETYFEIEEHIADSASSPVLQALCAGIRQTALGREYFNHTEKIRREGLNKKQAETSRAGILLTLKNKQLSRMKADDLKQYCELLGLPVKDMNRKQCIEAIKKELTETVF